MNSKLVSTLLSALAVAGTASAANINWANTATDFNADASWTGGVAPANDTTTDIGVFSGAATNQPSLTADRSINGLSFASNGWILGGSNTLTLGSGGISQSGGGNAIVINSNLALTGTLSANIRGNTSSSLTVNGNVSGSGVTFKKDNTDAFGPNTTLVLNGANTYSGSTQIVSGTIAIGNNSALGTSTIENKQGFGAATPTLSASGGNRTISNQWEGGFTVTGTHDLTLTGDSLVANGSVDRLWTNNSTGKLTLSGAITTSVKVMTIRGTGVTQIAGSASNTGNDQGNNNGLTIGDGTVATLVEFNKTSGSDVTGGNVTILTNSTAQWLAPNQINDARELRLSGTANFNGFSETLGLLDINANSFIDLGGGGTNSIVFANSSGADWGSFTLSIAGTFVSGSSLRFGTTSGGLTSGQIALINIPGFSDLAIDSSGFLTGTSAIPEPSAFAALAGLGAIMTVGLRRRRRA